MRPGDPEAGCPTPAPPIGVSSDIKCHHKLFALALSPLTRLRYAADSALTTDKYRASGPCAVAAVQIFTKKTISQRDVFTI